MMHQHVGGPMYHHGAIMGPGRFGVYPHPFTRVGMMGGPIWGGYRFGYRPWGWGWGGFGVGTGLALGLGLGLAYRPWALYSWPGYTYPTYYTEPSNTTVIVQQPQQQQQQQDTHSKADQVELPPPRVLSERGVKKLEYDTGTCHHRFIMIEKEAVYMFHDEESSDASGSFPLLFDVVAYPVRPNTEPLAPNATSENKIHHHNIDVEHCFKVFACDPHRSYGARTYYFACQDDLQRDRMVQAINFNTVLLCENEKSVSEYVNRLLPVFASMNNGQLPADIDNRVHQQIDIIRYNRSLYLPPPPQGMVPPPIPKMPQAQLQSQVQNQHPAEPSS